MTVPSPNRRANRLPWDELLIGCVGLCVFAAICARWALLQ